tara:strand:+ start:79 stop:198 length:120 start_codon:yes stop_codon:yes gene_type:complete
VNIPLKNVKIFQEEVSKLKRELKLFLRGATPENGTNKGR